MDSSRFQRIASIPEGEFDSYVQTVMDEGLELTTAGTLRLWKSLQDDTPAEKQFLPHVEFEAIAGWLRARRETWPDEMKPHFKKFMTNLVGQLEEPSEDD